MLKRIGLLAVFLAGSAIAQDAPPAGQAPPPPPLPPKVQEEQLEPEVVIRREDDRIIEEYSQNGRVYMVKVTPENGIPYYYMDDDGDGQLTLQDDPAFEGPARPVYWKIKEW